MRSSSVWPASSHFILGEMLLKYFCLRGTLRSVPNTVAFGSFILPGVHKPKLFFSSLLVRAWCLRAAQGTRWLQTRLQCPMSRSQGIWVPETAFLAAESPWSIQVSRSVATCLPALALPFWPLCVHGSSCYFLTGTGLFYGSGGNVICFLSSKTVLLCAIKPTE